MSQIKQVGNSATGFSNNFMSMLSGLLGGPGSGMAQTALSNPIGATQGNASSILSDILSPGAGKLGGALGTMLGQQQQKDVNSINERFSSFGGTSLGSPGASAVANYKAQAAPQITSAIGNLQLGALGPLLGLGGNMANRGVTTPMMQSSPWLQGLQALGGAAGGASNILGALGMKGGGGSGGSDAATSLAGSYPIPQMPTGSNLLTPGFSMGSQSLLPMLMMQGMM